MNDAANLQLQQLRDRIEPLRQQLLQHPIYQDMHDPVALRIFMQHHVFAVWDFMSLLKALQQRLTCVLVPWIPPQQSLGCRLVNEIVLGEESDEDGQGGFGSHFDLYRQSMEEFGATGEAIDAFVLELRQGKAFDQVLVQAKLSDAVRQFISQTFATIATGDVCQICSAFTYGREDLLPDVFQKIVDEISARSETKLDRFQYYLERHIELDKGEHGPMTTRLMQELCGEESAKWQAAEEAAATALEARIALWDAIHREIREVRAR